MKGKRYYDEYGREVLRDEQAYNEDEQAKLAVVAVALIAVLILGGLSCIMPEYNPDSNSTDSSYSDSVVTPEEQSNEETTESPEENAE